MSLTKQIVEDRLLAYHLFPHISRKDDELPPCFQSRCFKQRHASALIRIVNDRKDGFGAITLQSTRYDLAPRRMEVPHPAAYANLVRQLKTSWEEWKSVEESPVSAITIFEHDDKRIFSMTSRKSVNQLISPSSRYMAKVDITNFYGSIYTHALPWAVAGVGAAKKDRDKKGSWLNNLDWALRMSRRKETTGISIGPGTSAIVGEIILEDIDRKLEKNFGKFVRFIDDYYYVADTKESAEEFVNYLRDELSTLKLSVHPGKTKIVELPAPLHPQWKRDLRAMVRGRASVTKLTDMVDEVISHTEISEEDGALRYALVTIENIFEHEEHKEESLFAVIERLMHVAFFRPVATGTMCRLLEKAGPSKVAKHSESLNAILAQHVSVRRTDAATWILYLLIGNSVRISTEAVQAIVKSGDCLSLSLLLAAPECCDEVASFIQAIESKEPESFTRDEYWILYYELARRGNVPESVPDDYLEEFRALLDDNVSFIDIKELSGQDIEEKKPTKKGGKSRVKRPRRSRDYFSVDDDLNVGSYGF